MEHLNIAAADIVVIAIIAVFGIIGWRKGLLKSAVGIVSLAASLILARMLYPFVTDVLTAFGIRDYVYAGVLEKTMIKSGGNHALMLPEALGSALDNAVTSAAEGTAGCIADVVLNIVSFVSVAIISVVVIKIAAKLLGVVSKLPVLNGLNRLGGLILGLVEGVVIVCVVTAMYAGTLPESGEKSGEITENSVIFKKMYNDNPITNIFIENETEEIHSEQY